MNLELEKAVIQYLRDIRKKEEEQDFPDAIEAAFKAGAEWQKQHPMWISVYDDLPSLHKELLIDDKDTIITKTVFCLDRDHNILLSNMYLPNVRHDDLWHWSVNVPLLAWMLIPEYK